MAEQLYQYQVRASSLTIPRRVYRLTVAAMDADDARRNAALVIGPDFGPTVEPPKRRAAIVPDDDKCWHMVVQDQERIDGIFYGVCAECHDTVAAVGDEDEQGQPGWETTDREFVDYHGVKVEVA